MTKFTIEALADIKEIEFLKSRYCRMIDSKQWEGLPDLFSSEASFEGFGGGLITSAPQFIARIAKLLGGSVTVHHLHHHEIRIVSATEATGVWAMMDYNEWPTPGVLRHVPEATGFCGYGFYEERYRLIDGSWRIEFMRLARLRLDPLVRGGHERIDLFETKGLISPSANWLESSSA
jgi:hypothetical protein